MQPKDLLKEIEESARSRGLEPSTLCLYAGLGGDLLPRLERQAESLIERRGRLREYLRQHDKRVAAKAQRREIRLARKSKRGAEPAPAEPGEEPTC